MAHGLLRFDCEMSPTGDHKWICALSWDDGLGVCRPLGGGDWLEEIPISEG